MQGLPKGGLWTRNLTHCSARSRFIILGLGAEEASAEENEGLRKSGLALHRPVGKRVEVESALGGDVHFWEQLWCGPPLPPPQPAAG